MDSSTLTAILAGAGTLIGSVAGIFTSARMTNYRLKQLEDKVNKHNNLVERMATVETKVENLEKAI